MAADLSGWLVEAVEDANCYQQMGGEFKAVEDEGGDYSLAVRDSNGRQISIYLPYPPVPKGTVLFVQSERDSMVWATTHRLSNTEVRGAYPLILRKESIRPLFRLDEPPAAPGKEPNISTREFLLRPDAISGLVIYDIISAGESIYLQGEGTEEIELTRIGDGFERRVERTVYAPETAQFLLLNPFRKRSREKLRFTYTEVQNEWVKIEVPWDVANNRLATIEQYPKQWYDLLLHFMALALSRLGCLGGLFLALGVPAILSLRLPRGRQLSSFITLAVALAICFNLLLEFEGEYEKQNALSLEAMRYVDAHKLEESGTFNPFYVPVNEIPVPYIFWRNIGRLATSATVLILAGWSLWAFRTHQPIPQHPREYVGGDTVSYAGETINPTYPTEIDTPTETIEKTIGKAKPSGDWFSDLFTDRTTSAPTQGWSERNRGYRNRTYRESKERLIEDITGSMPRRGWVEHDENYVKRIAHEANERIVESATGSQPWRRMSENNEDYRSRVALEANERIVAAATGSEPWQRPGETKEDYGRRIAEKAKECIIEKATGKAPVRGWSESVEDYGARISREAQEIKASRKPDDNSENGSGCFLTTACVEFAGLPDDCHELTVLRNFRDNYIAHLPSGMAMLLEYYKAAPDIVAELSQSPRRETTYGWILAEIRKAVTFIEKGDYDAALATYSNMFNDLNRAYPTASQEGSSQSL